MERIRRNRMLFFSVAFAVPFAAGLAMALWYRSSGELIMKIVGAFAIAVGVVQLTLRRVFEPDPRADPAVVAPAERQALIHFRFTGVTMLLIGIAQFFPDVWVRTTFMACAAIVCLAGMWKVPRRLFEAGRSE